jgi:hypothetical protein
MITTMNARTKKRIENFQICDYTYMGLKMVILDRSREVVVVWDEIFIGWRGIMGNLRGGRVMRRKGRKGKNRMRIQTKRGSRWRRNRWNKMRGRWVIRVMSVRVKIKLVKISSKQKHYMNDIGWKEGKEYIELMREINEIPEDERVKRRKWRV